MFLTTAVIAAPPERVADLLLTARPGPVGRHNGRLAGPGCATRYSTSCGSRTWLASVSVSASVSHKFFIGYPATVRAGAQRLAADIESELTTPDA